MCYHLIKSSIRVLSILSVLTVLNACGGSSNDLFGEDSDSSVVGDNSDNAGGNDSSESGNSNSDSSGSNSDNEDDSNENQDSENSENDELAEQTFSLGMAALNDTGIGFGSTMELNGNSCNVSISTSNGQQVAQDCSQGRSVVANSNSNGVNGFDFTRINADGSEYSGNGNYASEPWACVRDNRTGLLWEVKSTDGGVHDSQNTYRWGGLTAQERTEAGRTGDYYNDWNELIIATNESAMCGFSDWQVPTNVQLMSIAHYGIDSRPLKIDRDYFPNTVDSFYWTAMPYQGAHGQFYAWAFQFVFGNNKNLQRYQPAAIRLVRPIDSEIDSTSGDNLTAQRYSIIDDGTVLDLATGLMWSQCLAGLEGVDCGLGVKQSMDWGEALEYAQTSSLAGYNDWRLPNSKELFSIVDFSRVEPAINLDMFPNTGVEYTWSSSPMIEFAQDSWFVNFKTGLNWFKGRSDKMLVRVVRSGIEQTLLAEQDTQQRNAIVTDDGFGTVEGNTSPVDIHAKILIEEQGYTSDPTSGRNLPDVNSPKAQLGKALFYSKRLSGEYDTACASCHHPVLGGGDNLSWPVGYDAVDVFHNSNANLLGAGRYFNGDDAGEMPSYPVIGRNAPTVFNIGLLDKGLFWDSRIESKVGTKGARGTDAQIITPESANYLSADDSLPEGASLANAQSRFPTVSHNEMRGDEPLGSDNQSFRDMLALRFVGDDEWEALFASAYGDSTINFNRIAEAIATFEESMVFTSNPWFEYVSALSGETSANVDALTEEQKVGAVLFMTAGDEGGAACSSCHSGDAFTDEQHHAIGLGQVGPGNGDNNPVVTGSDFGRQKVTGDIGDAYHFRTSPLLNIAVTGPYMHNGALSTLRQVMDVYGNPGGAMNDLLGVGTILDPNAQFNENGNADYCELFSVLGIMDKTGESCEQVYNNMNPNAFNNTRVLFRQTFDESVSHSPAPEIDINIEQSEKVIQFMDALTDPCVIDRECLQPWIFDHSNWTGHPDYNDNPNWILIGENESGESL